MTCNVVAQPFTKIIQAALLTAGKSRKSGVTDGFWAEQAQECLELIIGQWSAEDLYNFYISEVQFLSFDAKLEYNIGLGMDIDEQPFSTITSAWFSYAGRNIPIQFEPMQSFNYGTFQNSVGLPRIYTYNNQYQVTNLKMLPRAQNNLLITINGKQELGIPSIFDTNIKIPTYAKPALIYQVANELYARGAGTPNGNFSDSLKYHLSVLKKCSKQDRQTELKPALFGGQIGKGSYFLNGAYGAWGAGGNGF